MTIIVQTSAALVDRLTAITVFLLDEDTPDNAVAFEACRREVLRAAIERGLASIENSLPLQRGNKHSGGDVPNRSDGEAPRIH